MRPAYTLGTSDYLSQLSTNKTRMTTTTNPGLTNGQDRIQSRYSDKDRMCDQYYETLYKKR